jgi:alkylation response protein AidB-like acyl-CoA dehydrogenase
MLLGEEGNGWHQVTAELAFERSGPERFLSTYPLLAEFARRAAASPDPAQLATVGRLSARLLALRQLSLRIAAALDRGELPDIPAALVKDVGTSFEGDVVEEVRRVVDVPASLDSPDPLGRALAEAQLHQPGYTLRGGTNEILKGIVARGLGLR